MLSAPDPVSPFQYSHAASVAARLSAVANSEQKDRMRTAIRIIALISPEDFV